MTGVNEGTGQPLHKYTRAPSPPTGLARVSRVRVGVRVRPDPDLAPGPGVCQARKCYSMHTGGQTSHCTSIRVRSPPYCWIGQD